ncbi:hypothetical protein TanjilG_18093 [Lupinus angustifolius]|uniref:Uncharacterized protein n=1 Tax=Lupinus angustifolius TaxID=3871 RepID=A0A1J7H4X1_LUPAN|nr:hypothetical protein TanjilG_18093 [Lupinus angustifolius]
MVPVYALESFLSLLNSSAAFNCEVIRDCYEAFALYCFERYLIACLVPYKRGERCVRNVAVMADYASIGTPPDPVEVQDCERSTRMWVGRHNEREKRKFTHNVRDVVLGSGEIIVDDMKFTVSHVVEPVERGIAKINKTFHQISENMKRHDEERRRSNKVKDDSYLIPLHSWTTEFSDAHDKLVEGSVSDSGLSGGKRQRNQSNASLSRMRR